MIGTRNPAPPRTRWMLLSLVGTLLVIGLALVLPPAVHSLLAPAPAELTLAATGAPAIAVVAVGALAAIVAGALLIRARPR